MKHDLIKTTIDYIVQLLDELYSAESNCFVLGQIYSLIDVLENIQASLTLREKVEFGLAYVIESKYPVP